MLQTSFQSFFRQASEQIILKEQQEGVLKHLTHLEELILTQKQQGLEIAISFLKELFGTLKGNSESKVYTTIKYDGCIHQKTKVVTDSGSCTIQKIIEDFNAGKHISVQGFDFVLNKETLTRVSNAHSSVGSKSWIEIELENGDYFRCTEDHEIYTMNRGWIEAKNLTNQDILKFLP